MKNKQSIFFGLAILCIASALKLPLWLIELWAPQYPEGLRMYIYADQIGGDVTQVNILNHYVGMKHIIPDQIPELTMIPWALAAAAIFGIIVILFNKQLLPKIWLGILIILGAVGLFDFYRWGYDYGHNLSPDAPIKIPGLTYQPPLIGYKKILNIEAYSLPSWGAYALGLSVVFILIGIYWNYRQQDKIKPEKKAVSPKAKLRQSFGHSEALSNACIAICISILFSMFSLACTVKPEPLNANSDHCETCHMQLADTRFGAEVITKKGRILKFDSLSCLAEYLAQSTQDTKQDTKSILVADYFNNGTLISHEKARYLKSDQIKGPMGANIVASENFSRLEELAKTNSGKVLNWEDSKLTQKLSN